MLRFVAILAWLALVSLVSLTVKGAVKAGLAVFRFWTSHKLGAKLFPKWAKRRAMKSWTAEHGGPPDEVRESFNSDEPEKEVHVSEATQSLLRGLAKVAAGVLVTKGVIDVGEAGALQVVLETLAAGVVGAVAFYMSHKKHAA